MTRWRRAMLIAARPRNVDELEVLLPDAAFEAVGDRQELVIYTGWQSVRHRREKLRPMKEDA